VRGDVFAIGPMRTGSLCPVQGTECSEKTRLTSPDLAGHAGHGAFALSSGSRASTAFALSPPKLLGAEGWGLTPVARRAQAT
jgi:hypothetical protein